MRDKMIKELNSLIQLDYDASIAYDRAIENVDDLDSDVRADLEAFREDHMRHVRDLRRVIMDLGGTPLEPNRDMKGILLEGMTKLRSSTGTLGALKAMRTNEKLTNRTYEDTAELGLPAEAQPIVAINLTDERRHLDAIESHITRLSSADYALDDDDDTTFADDIDVGPPRRHI